MPLLAVGLYLTHGSPGLSSYPIAGRAGIPLESAQIGDLVAKVEARLRERPDDGEGGGVLCPGSRLSAPRALAGMTGVGSTP